MKNLFTTLLLCLTMLGSAQITLVKDIYPGSNTSAIDHITATDYGYMLFIARSGTTEGVELWRSDGTAVNTYQVKDIYPGSNPSYPLIYHDLGGGIIGMRADNGINGYEPWITDGTEAGTQMIADINPGSSNSIPLTTNGFVWGTTGTGIHLIPLSDGNSNNGTELWKTDGTAAGTVLVKDIYAGTGSSGPKDFTEVGNKVAFTAYSGTAARELFISDGTTLGTDIILDINPGIASSSPADLTFVGGKLFFSADDGVNGRELWTSDGTPGGTSMLLDINPNSSSNPEILAAVNGMLFFWADDDVHGAELWRTDGTPGGTVMVKDINPFGDSKYIIPYHGTMGGRIYFNATDGVNGTEAWVSDGTENGTYMLKDIRDGEFGSNPNGFYGTENFILMSAYTATEGFELWASDGTENGTFMVEELNAGVSCGCPADFITWNDDVFFTADNGSTGREFYKIALDDICVATNIDQANAIPLSTGVEYDVSTSCGVVTGVDYGCTANPGKEVWYSFTAPASGEVTIQAIDLYAYDSGFNVVLTVFDGLGNVVDCANNNGNLGDESLTLLGLTSGTDYYICLQNTQNQTGLCTLRLNGPCSIDSVTAGAQTVCDPADNTFTQEVIVSYTNAPDSGDLVVDGQAFPLTSSPQTVVLVGLDSDGSLSDVDVYFSDEPGCSMTSVGLFTAPASCNTPGESCSSPIDLPVSAACSPVLYDGTGATTSGYGSPSCGFYQGGDMWFSVTMPASGHLTVELFDGTNTNPHMTMYSGTCGGVLTPLDCNANQIYLHDESLAGETLLIQVYKFNNATNGTFSLCAYEPDIPDNDFCEEAVALNVGSSCSMQTFTNANCTFDENDPLPECGFFKGGDVWFTAVVPASGHFRLELVDGTNNNPHMGVFTGTCGSLTSIECDNDYITIHDEALAGETLYIRVFKFNSQTGGTFQLCAWEPNIPDNDMCSDAISLIPSTTCITQQFSNAYCTQQDELVTPSCGFYKGGDLWFSTIMPASGHLNVTVEGGTNNNPRVAIFSGTCGLLLEEDCDNNSINLHDETLAGQTLYISVYKYNNDQGGTFDICVWEPNIADNDFCANAFPLTVGLSCMMEEHSNGNATSTEDATVPSPNCGFYQGGDVWFTVVMPASGHLFVDTDSGANNNPVLALYTGTCSTLILYACNHNSSDNDNNGELTIHDESLAGQTLYVRAYSHNSEDGGTFSICASEVPIPDNDFCSSAEPLIVESGFCNYSTYSNQYATETEDASVPAPGCGYYQGADVWFSLIVPLSGEMVVDLDPGTNVNPNLALYTGTCESLALYVCDDSSSDNGGFVGKLVIDDISLAGETVYIRVWNRSSVNGGTFGICAYDPSACAIGTISVGTQTSCIPGTNFYTQEVTFEYVNEPVTGTVLLNGQSFSIDGSAQTVVLTNLYSDFAPVDLEISFSDAPGCTATVPSAWIAAEQCCAGDLNGDQIVNASDLLIFLGGFGCTVDCEHDINGDGEVNTEDLLLFLGNFGQICP